MRPVRLTAVALVLSAVLAIAAVLPAAANGPTRQPWSDGQPVWITNCRFPVVVTPVIQKQRLSLFTDKNGNPIRDSLSGVFRANFTNEETGFTLYNVNLSGPIHSTYLGDITLRTTSLGPTVAWGLWYEGDGRMIYLHGRRVAVTEEKSLISDAYTGRAIDLCAALDH